MNNELIIKTNREAWFQTVYRIEGLYTYFEAYKVESFTNDGIPNLESKTPYIKGFIKWDGCMEFEQKSHYCGLYHAKQTLMLMEEIHETNDWVNETYRN